MASKPAYVPVADLLSLAVGELDRSINKPNILNYTPYPEQKRFHCSEKPGRYVAGGNRGGKTDAIVVESIYWATNTHPFRKRPAAWGHGAIQQRIVVVDVEKGVNQIMIPKFKRWIASSMLVDGSWDKSWDAKGLILTFANGSTIDFLTFGMELDKHGGVPRHIVYFDEEPPQHIFNENLMRLMDYDGWWVISATPVRGMGWTYDMLWEPAENDPDNDDDSLPAIFTLSAAQNPYLQAEDRGRFMIAMSKEERETREDGKFVARSGLVFPSWTKESHVVDPFIPPKNWEWYSSTDHGWNNPTAWYWHAVSPEGDIVTFAEHYADKMTVQEHSTLVRMREAAWGRSPDVRTGDPAMKQGNGITGTSVLQEYSNHGIYIGVEGIPHEVIIGVEKMQQYFRIQKENRWGSNRPKWVITSNCVNLIRELKKLRWKTYSSDKTAYELNKLEQIHKKDDHGFDSVRYFSTMMPDLAGEGLGNQTVQPTIIPTTISYAEMMNLLREDETVEFVDDALSTDWDTTEAWDYAGF